MLPNVVRIALASETWRTPTKKALSRWEAVFSHGLVHDAVRVLSEEDAVRATAYLRCHSEEFAKHLRPDLGRYAISSAEVCDVDIARCVVIADLSWHPRAGDGPVTPVALELFDDEREGRVVCYPDDAFEQYWVEIAPTFAELLRLLAG